MLTRTVLVRDSDHVVAEPPFMAPDTYEPPQGYTAVQSDTANLGDSYDPNSGSFAPWTPPKPVVDLVAYAQAKQATLAEGGYAYNVAPAGKPAQIAYADTNLMGRTNLNGLKGLADLDPKFTTIWLQSEGNLTLGADQIKALAQAVGLFVVSTYPALAAVLSDIASGKTTSTDQIDEAAWPANSGSLA